MKKKNSTKARKSKAPKAPKVLTLWDRLPKNEGERLELLISMTEKNIRPGSKDTTMADQAVRLRAKLEEWKKNNK